MGEQDGTWLVEEQRVGDRADAGSEPGGAAPVRRYSLHSNLITSHHSLHNPQGAKLGLLDALVESSSHADMREGVKRGDELLAHDFLAELSSSPAHNLHE